MRYIQASSPPCTSLTSNEVQDHHILEAAILAEEKTALNNFWENRVVLAPIYYGRCTEKGLTNPQ